MCMNLNNKSKTRTFKKHSTHVQKTADKLVKTHENLEKLQKKKIDTAFLDIFK